MEHIYKIECYSEDGERIIANACSDNAVMLGLAVVTTHVFDTAGLIKYVSNITEDVTAYDLRRYIEANIS